MNRKQFVILLVLVVVIGGIGLSLYKKNAVTVGEGRADGQKLLGAFSINDVAQITIKEANGEVTLGRKSDVWTVKERNDYAANFSEITDFVRKVSDLKIVQSEKIGPSQFARLELVEPGKGNGSGTVVSFKDASGKELKQFILGKKHTKKSAQPSPYGGEGDFADGRWVMVGGASEVALIADPLNNVQGKPENWLDKEFFKIERVKSVSLVSTNATNSWKLSRESDSAAWALADVKAGEVLDTNKVSGIGGTLSSPSFNDVSVNEKDTGLDHPTVVTLETFDHFIYTLKLGKTKDEAVFMTMAVKGNFPAERIAGKDEKKEDKDKLDKEFKDNTKKLEDKLKQEAALEKWIYLVPKWALDSILKDRAHLMVEKTEEKADDKPAAASPVIPSSLPF